MDDSTAPRRGADLPLFEPTPGGVAERIGRSLARLHPVVAFILVAIGIWAVVAGFSILLGHLVTDVLVPIDSVENADEWLPKELATERTGFWDDVSWFFSTAAGGIVLPAILVVLTIVCVVLRKWLIAGFMIIALSLESATYRVTSWVTPRQRPQVERLEGLEPDASYPSGHTAASIAVYIGLALLATYLVRSRGARIAIWVVALLMPPAVALSRIYRGMHHPIDALGGVVIGTLALFVVALGAARITRAVVEARDEQKQGETRRIAA
jgi:undecaprenyl-diphosphatase